MLAFLLSIAVAAVVFTVIAGVVVHRWEQRRGRSCRPPLGIQHWES